MSSAWSSTIADERLTNDALQIRDVQEFVLSAASVSTPRPPTTERVVALNRGPWVAQPPMPAQVNVPDGATVLDVRPFSAYTQGHIPGAISVPLDGGAFGTKAGFVLVEGERIVLHAGSREQADEAARKLWAVGILDIAGYVTEPHASEELGTVDVDELRRLLESPDVQLVDVRETAERDGGYIPGSQNVPYRLLRQLGCGALDRSRPVVTVCESGPRAAIAASLLRREGFDVRAVVDGGIADFSDTVAFRRCGA
jgi:hydroxyacylglutathione hydrolase